MVRRSRIVLLMVVMGWFGTACSTQAPPQTSTQVGDTLVVRSSAPVIPDTLVPREVTRVGRLNGPLEHVFSDVSLARKGRRLALFAPPLFPPLFLLTCLCLL